MTHQFDEEINRVGTFSKKWDTLEKQFGTDSLIPMWVADMDFKSPDLVVEALTKRAREGVYGYTIRTDTYLESIVNWFDKRHDWKITKEWISQSPGIVPALSMIIHAFTEPGDKVLVQSPVHHAFYRAINMQGREVVENRLEFRDGRYNMNLDALKEKIDSSVKMMILCNPHNPVGRVWSKEELKRLGDICMDKNILVVSDEIFCDLVYKPNRFVPFLVYFRGIC